MKKHLFFLFAALLPLLASAQTKVEIDGIWYNLITEGNVAEVTYKGSYSSQYNEYTGSITIPATVNYEGVTYCVTSIGESAFYGCSSLTSITIPENSKLTSIGRYAVAYCSSLTSINIPESVTSIGSCAFYNCSSLTTITVDERNTVYDSRSGCNAIIETNSNTLISGCSATIIPEGVTNIGDYAFSSCSSLTSITIPESVTSIGKSAFYGCGSLTSITIPESVTSIGDKAFYDCTSLTSINIPEGVTSIEYGAFSKCSSLTAITIPEGVTSIGETAFFSCSSLTSINIPEGVTSIGSEAFNGCRSLTSVHISDIAAWCNIKFTSETSNPLHCAENLYLNGELVTELTIPEIVTSIGSYAFWNCRSLTSITIPAGSQLTSIGSCAFYNCSSLTAITIPESVTSIGGGAFYKCSSLTSITIPENSQLTSIGSSAFSYCSKLKEITFGKNLKKITSDSFPGCYSIEKVTIHATQPPTTDGYIFEESVYENATLYVPQGSISKYQVMTGWSGFYNILEIEGGTTEYLTVRQADNGEVGIAVDFGRTYKVRIAPSTGWKIHTVTLDGKDMTAQLAEDNTFTTPTLNASAVLNVAYVKADNAVENALANAVKVSGHNGIINICGISEGEAITIYTLDGAMVANATATAEMTSIEVPTLQVYIVKVANKVVKIGM